MAVKAGEFRQKCKIKKKRLEAYKYCSSCECWEYHRHCMWQMRKFSTTKELSIEIIRIKQLEFWRIHNEEIWLGEFKTHTSKAIENDEAASKLLEKFEQKTHGGTRVSQSGIIKE